MLRVKARVSRVGRRWTATAERRLDDALREAVLATLWKAEFKAGPPDAASSDLHLGAVLAAYTVDTSLAAIRALIASLPRSATIVVVANTPEVYAAIERQSEFILLRGSNRDHEFSAYDEGLEALRKLDSRLEVVIFANDRLNSYRDGFLPLLTPRVLAFVRDHRLALGNLDDPGRRFSTPFGPLERYLRGNLVVIPVGALDGDFTITSISTEDFDRVVPREFPFEAAESTYLEALLADAEYASFLWRWLTTAWYRGGALNPDNWARLRAKVRDILNEHWLSVRLVAAGVVPVYAEQAAATALISTEHLRQKEMLRLVQEVHRVGDLRHGDASVMRTARSLALALKAAFRQTK